MASFVLAGKADCPYYAKAELLADALQMSLPNFRTRKIVVLPHQWMEWLDGACKRRGWNHDKSPVVWRELVEEGSTEMLIGGHNEFLEHCQDYYGITLDLSTNMMLSIAAENLKAKVNISKEEQHHICPIEALRIWIIGARNPTCQLLIPNLLSAEVFPRAAAICLHLLELEGDEEGLQGLRMETQDLALPLLHQVTIHSDLEHAFLEADVILLLDEWWSDDSDAEHKSEEEEKEKVKEVCERYREYGRLIDARASRRVKVIVGGGSLVNLRCSLLVESAHHIDSRQFVAMATQLENEARAILANKLGVRASDIKHIIVWGNISGSSYIDPQMAKVFNYNGPIKGPSFFFQSVQKVFYDRLHKHDMITSGTGLLSSYQTALQTLRSVALKWLETDFQDLVRCQHAAVTSKTCRAASMSAANGILAVLKAWNGDCGPDEVFSLGVLCPGYHNLPEGIIFSVPVTFTDDQWSLLLDVSVGGELKERLQLSARELNQEKELAAEIGTNK